MLYYGVWGLCYSSTNTTRDTDGEATPYSFLIMAKNNTRDLILDKTYRLLFIYNWEAIRLNRFFIGVNEYDSYEMLTFASWKTKVC